MISKTDGPRVASPGNTAYYIDPVSGSDERNGRNRGEAWKTFAPLNRLALAPGDRVEILTPGSFMQSLAITGAGTEEAPITVHFAPGRYDFHPANAERRIYNISNCNDGVDDEKAIGILFERASHVAVSGPDAKVVFRGKMIEICIDHSEAITVDGLAFDYLRPTVSEFTVAAVTEEYADLTVHKDSWHRLEDGKIKWQGEGWSYDTGLAQELIPETEEVWRRKDPLVGLRIEELGPNGIRAHGDHGMIAGRVFQLRNTFRDCCGVFVRRSKGVTFQNIDFHYLHGMGVLCQFTENITLDTVRIAPEEGSGRTSAAWADCTHFSGCRGKIILKDCLFCGAHDDAANIHGTNLRIIEQISENQIRVQFAHRQTFGFMAFNPGDEIEFQRWDSLVAFGTSRVKDATMVDPRELVLTLEEEIPSDWRTNDVIENVTWTPSLEITGCTAKRIPSRGFLVTTRRPAVVRDNVFIRLRVGVHMSSDARDWFESGCVRDVEIFGNRFVECRRAAVQIDPHNIGANPSLHQNIRITDNEIAVPAEGKAVEAHSTSGLTVTGNRIAVHSAVDPEAIFPISDCKDVKIEDNEITGDRNEA